MPEGPVRRCPGNSQTTGVPSQKEREETEMDENGKTPEEAGGELSFEAALERLETIVRTLEGGRASLDDSMKYYEEGVRLVRYCTSRLEEARSRMKVVGPGTGAENE